MLGVVEGVGHGLVDRHRYRARRRVGRIAPVHGYGLETPLGITHCCPFLRLS